MIWRINDVEVKTQTSNIPKRAYVRWYLNSGVVGDQPQIPTRLEVIGLDASKNLKPIILFLTFAKLFDGINSELFNKKTSYV